MKKFSRCILILILVAVLSGVGGYIYENRTLMPMYRSTAKLYVVPGAENEASVRAKDGGLNDDFIVIFKSDVVISAAKRTAGTSEDIAQYLTVSSPANSNIVEITCVNPDQNTAKTYVDAVANTAIRTTSIIPVSSIQILEKGTSTGDSFQPNLYRNTLIIMALACTVCIFIELLVALFMSAFKKKKDDDYDELEYERQYGYIESNALEDKQLRNLRYHGSDMEDDVLEDLDDEDAELMSNVQFAKKPEPVKQEEPIKPEEPVSQPEPVRQEAPVSQPEPVRQEEPVRQPEPIRQEEPVRQPEPVSQPEPIRQEEPVRQPEPIRQEEPVRQPEPVRQEEPVSQPEPIRQEEPVSQPEPVRQEEPVSQPEPVKPEEPVKSFEVPRIVPYGMAPVGSNRHEHYAEQSVPESQPQSVPEPQPQVVQSVPEPQPQVVQSVQSVPEPQPQAVQSVPEPQPQAVQSVPEPQPQAIQPEQMQVIDIHEAVHEAAAAKEIEVRILGRIRK